MAVIYSKYVLFFLLSSIFSTAFAGPEFSIDPKIILERSEKNFELSLKKYESLIESCDKNKKTIDPSLISHLNMTVDELKTTLFTLNHRAEIKCYKGYDNAFFVNAAKHREVSERYGKNAEEALAYDQKFYSAHWKILEYEEKYSLIDERIRTKLDAINELKVPFLVIQSLNKIKPGW